MYTTPSGAPAVVDWGIVITIERNGNDQTDTAVCGGDALDHRETTVIFRTRSAALGVSEYNVGNHFSKIKKRFLGNPRARVLYLRYRTSTGAGCIANSNHVASVNNLDFKTSPGRVSYTNMIYRPTLLFGNLTKRYLFSTRPQFIMYIGHYINRLLSDYSTVVI